jgi:hypothetical protein
MTGWNQAGSQSPPWFLALVDAYFAQYANTPQLSSSLKSSTVHASGALAKLAATH